MHNDHWNWQGKKRSGFRVEGLPNARKNDPFFFKGFLLWDGYETLKGLSFFDHGDAPTRAIPHPSGMFMIVSVIVHCLKQCLSILDKKVYHFAVYHGLWMYLKVYQWLSVRINDRCASMLSEQCQWQSMSISMFHCLRMRINIIVKKVNNHR